MWDETWRTARVEHSCVGCDRCDDSRCTGKSIKPGHRYRRTAVLFDGSWMTWKHCIRCAAMLDALRPRLRECFTTDTLDLSCGEVWDDPPEHVAALAFVLPGESVTALLGEVTP